MTEAQQKSMLSLQQTGLTMDDLLIYLDTHTDDDFAMQRFNETAEKYKTMVQEYTARYSPLLSICGQNGTAEWQWALTDFPWDY